MDEIRNYRFESPRLQVACIEAIRYTMDDLEIPLPNSDSSCRYRTRFDFTNATRRWIFSFWPASANGEPFGVCLGASDDALPGLMAASFLDHAEPIISRSYCPCRLIQNCGLVPV